MLEQRLRKRLRPVMARRAWANVLQALAFCWVGAAIIGGVLLFAVRTNNTWTPAVPINFALMTLTALVITWIITVKRTMDIKSIVRDIEQTHPEIKAMLLAAVEQKSDGGELSYLQERVIKDAIEHAANNEWAKAVPGENMALSGGAIALGVLLYGGVMWQLLIPPMHERTVDAPQVVETKSEEPKIQYNLTVLPGDTVVEQGASVVVIARFEGPLPPDVTLVVKGQTGTTQNLPLAKNLEDPVFGGSIPQVNEDLLYYLDYADQRTRDFRIDTFNYPQLLQADATIKFPEYTDLEDKTVEDTQYVSALEGSDIIATFHLNKEVQTATLIDEEGVAIELTKSDDQEYAYVAQIKAMKSQRFELYLIDDENRRNRIPPRFNVDVHKNLPPALTMVFPRRDQRVSPLEELSLEAEVSDDFGLNAYGLSYAVGGMDVKDVTLGTALAANTTHAASYLIALESLNAKPDQLVSYFFWAEDVGPKGDVRRTSSDMYFAEVRHFEEIFREGMRPPGEQQEPKEGEEEQKPLGEKLAAEQKQVINATWKVKRQAEVQGTSDQYVEDVQLIREAQLKVLEESIAGKEKITDKEMLDALNSAITHMTHVLTELNVGSTQLTIESLTPALAHEQAAYQDLLKLRAREYMVMKQQAKNSSSSSKSSKSSQRAASRQQQQLNELEMKQKDSRYESKRQAKPQREQEQRENLQVLNRLRELAQRQNDMKDKIKELQTELQAAETQKEKEELQRQLKRLQDEQRDILRDVDELQERMNQEENRQRMAESRKQLDQTREQVRETAEALEKNQVTKAMNSSTRAQRDLEKMKEDFRKKTSNQFAEDLKDMRQDSRELVEQQEQIAQELQGELQKKEQPKRLSDAASPGPKKELNDQITQQQEALSELTKQMREVIQKAETAEPLLAEKLYDSLRDSKMNNVEERLAETGEWLRRNFRPQAQAAERKANEGIQELNKGIEAAAESILGDETEALQMARNELDDLIEQLDQEIANKTGRRPEATNESHPQQQQQQQQQQPQGSPNQANPNGEERQANQSPDQSNDNPQVATRQSSEQRQREQAGEQAANRQSTEQRSREQSGQQDSEQVASRQSSQQRQREQDGQQQDGQQQDGQQQAQANQQQDGQQQNGQQQQAQANQQQQAQANQQQSEQQQQQQQQQAQANQQQSGQQQAQANQQQSGQQQAQANQQQSGQQQAQANQQQSGQQQAQANQQQSGQQQNGQQQAQANQQQNGQPQQQATQQSNANRQADGNQFLNSWGSQHDGGPLTGGEFRDWTDRLRDLEEMLGEPKMRGDVARVRDQARSVRAEFKRHSKEPKWDVVEKKILEPLVELRQRVSEEIARRQPDENLVPIDRDPVANRYSELVRRYYENLSK